MSNTVARRSNLMRTTVTLDDELMKRAELITGLTERATLLRAGLLALIERESARRLALLAGSQPRIKDVPRRRAKPA
jgi:Arc/MetJ family transcription regulator